MNNGNWIEEWAKSLGITQPVNGTWIQAINEYYGGEVVNGTHLRGIAQELNVTESGDILTSIGNKLGVSKHNGGVRGGFRKHFKNVNDGVTPSPSEPTPTPPPIPSEPTPQGLYWDSSIGTTNVNKSPAYGLYDYSTYAMIVKASELDEGIDLFNKLQFQVGGYTNGYTYNSMVIKMYHISSASFIGTTYPDLRNQSVSDETTIWSGDLVLSNGWNEITFDTNFDYNGTDNIVILFENRKGDWGSGYGWGENHYVGSNIVAYTYQDNSYPTGSMVKYSRRLNVKLGY